MRPPHDCGRAALDLTRRPPAVRRGLSTLIPALGLIALLGLGGCASGLGVQPWERNLLAEPAMQLVASPMDAAVDDHIHFSKEASTGGRGFGGGGCGCN